MVVHLSAHVPDARRSSHEARHMLVRSGWKEWVEQRHPADEVRNDGRWCSSAIDRHGELEQPHLAGVVAQLRAEESRQRREPRRGIELLELGSGLRGSAEGGLGAIAFEKVEDEEVE